MNMKKAVFDYRKDSGEVSRRKVAIIAKPSNNYFGLDLSDLDESQAQQVISAYNAAHAKFQSELKTLGIANRYRYFKEANTSNITIN
jgi:hypothetical protein